MSNVAAERVSAETQEQKVGADSRFLRWDLVPLQKNPAGLLMGQLADSLCAVLRHGGLSDH